MKKQVKPCGHDPSNRFHMPDSLADVCRECGLVYVDGEPWQHRSGHIREWAKDLAEAKGVGK